MKVSYTMYTCILVNDTSDGTSTCSAGYSCKSLYDYLDNASTSSYCHPPQSEQRVNQATLHAQQHTSQDVENRTALSITENDKDTSCRTRLTRWHLLGLGLLVCFLTVSIVVACIATATDSNTVNEGMVKIYLYRPRLSQHKLPFLTK